MKKTLVLNEKPTQTQAMTDILTDTKKKGRAVFGSFKGKDMILFPLSGSVMQVDDLKIFPDKDRQNLDILPIMPPKGDYYTRTVGELKKKIYNEFKALTSKEDIGDIILATDPDYEGSALGLEILEALDLDKKHNIYAMDIGNIATEVLIRELDSAMGGKDAFNWRTNAQIAKMRADLNAGTGICGSRLLMKKTKSMTTFGNQQTRLLEKIVVRCAEHYGFEVVNYYRIRVKTSFGDFLYDIKSEEDAKDKDALDAIVKSIVDNPHLIVESMIQKPSILKAPKWFDGSVMAGKVASMLNRKVTELVREKDGLIQTMYDKKIMTYPRGESEGVMPLSQLAMQKEIALAISGEFNAPRLDTTILKKYLWRKDDAKNKEGKIINHTPYTIASKDVNRAKLTNDEKVVFDESAKMLLACFYPENKRKKITIKANIEGIPFVFEHSHDLDIGWKEIYGKEAILNPVKGDYARGDRIRITGKPEVEKYTKAPPPLYTQNSLLAMMKKYKIGAESTFTKHIENMLDKKRGFTKEVKNKVISTPKSNTLISIIPKDAIGALARFEAELIQPLELGTIDEAKAFNIRDEIIRDVYALLDEAIERNPKLAEKIGIESGTTKKEKIYLKGKCPKCGKAVYDDGKGKYTCDGVSYVVIGEPKKGEKPTYKNEGDCSFQVWGTSNNETAKFTIPRSEMERMLQGDHGVINVLWKKKDRKSDVKMKLEENGNTRFIFDN